MSARGIQRFNFIDNRRVSTPNSNAMKSSAAFQLVTWPLWIFLACAGALNARAQAPTITGFSPTSGPVGSTVVITGTNLIAPLILTVGTDAVESYGTNGIQISAVIPYEAVTGTITVITSAGRATTAGNFTVVPASTHPAFFYDEASLSKGVYYLQLQSGNIFGYYSYLADQSYIYSFDLGYEYLIDPNDGNDGIYLYDFASDTFFYTSPGYPYPYLYDFTLDAVLYYYGDGINYSRQFYDFSTGEIITK